jgi:hypothetical protein
MILQVGRVIILDLDWFSLQMQALKLLGLNVVKSTLSVDGAIGRKRFSITQG